VKRLGMAFIGLLCMPLVVTPAAAQDSFKQELTLGVQACKEAKYEEAMRHFQIAAALGPQNDVAHLYLGNVIAQQYIPGVESPQNLRLGEAAISEYKAVLEINPQSDTALKSIASLYLQMKKFDDAKSHYRKAIDLNPKDPETYFSIGVIDWTSAYAPRMKMREKLGVKPDEPLPVTFPGCWELRDSNLAAVQEGMEMLTKALELRPDYDDAMAYMNLLYRERAEIQCGDPESRSADREAADHWVDLTMGAKKRKIEKAAPKDENSTAPR
jgi:tetratricopeptide (TPR) repeat protein